jgi:glycosyltransferase involved in cell wall biosynthesis
MKIAVVLITYNHKNYVLDALEGIRTQSRVPDEVVIADDGSSDNTTEIIASYVKQHGLQDKWNLLFSKENRGININLQNAVDNTTAEVIVPMAGDDISLPNRCAELEKAFKDNPSIHIVTPSGYVINDNGVVIREINHSLGVIDNIRLAIRRGNSLHIPVGQGWRRSIFSCFGPLPADVPNEDDQINFWGLLSGGILCLPMKTFKYRVHDKSASAWLRMGQSNHQYFERFTYDMGIRERHILHWHNCLEKVTRSDREVLQQLIVRKAQLYRQLGGIEGMPMTSRVRFMSKNMDITCLREKVYLLFGKAGVLAWRNGRRILGRA